MMKFTFALFLAALTFLPLSGSEKVIRRFKDLTLDTATYKNPWKNIYSHSFYCSHKDFDENRTRTMEFRADATCTAGNAPLSCALRISTNPGNKLRLTRTFPQIKAEKGKTIKIVCRFVVPDFDNILNPNIQVAFAQIAKEHTAWELKNIRFVLAEEQGIQGSALKIEPADAAVEAAMVKTPLVLVKNGKAEFMIVLPHKQDNISDYAAEELQKHFELVTGAKPAIVKESAFKGGKAIFIGNTKIARKYGLAPDMLPLENFTVIRFKDSVILSGGDCKHIYPSTLRSRASLPVGTLYAAYEFIEQVLGVRWFWPGKLGTYIPKKKEISVGRMQINSAPANNTRTLFFEIPDDPDLEKQDIHIWFRRCRFGGSVGSPIANHAFRDWHKKYPDHPEYFALQPNGKRKVNGEQGVHLCFRNSDVLQTAIKEKIEELKKDNYSIFAAVMTGDSDALFHCRCPLCINDAKPERGDNGIYSDAMWEFVNKVAIGVGKEQPGKFIKCCAYGEYRLPPSFGLNPNVAVTLCQGGSVHGSKAYRDGVLNVLRAWQKTGAALYRWEYWCNTRMNRGIYGAPAVYPRQLKGAIALDRGIVKGRVIELANYDSYGRDTKNSADWIYDVQNLYLYSKLMWNPDTDIEKLLDEYYDGFFGPAGKTLRQFHDEMERASLKHYNNYTKGDWNYESCWQVCYPAPFVDKMMALLRRAVTECNGEQPYAARAAKLLKGYLPFERNSKMFRTAKKSENPREIKVPRTSDWNKALVIGNFHDSYNTTKLKSSTTMRFLTDGKKLSVKIECGIPKEHTDVNWANPKARDSYLWERESAELFFYGAGEKEYYQFILGPENALTDFFYTPGTIGNYTSGLQKSISWNCPGIRYSAKRNVQGWEGTLEIPLASLKFAKPMANGSWQVNFCRNHYYRPKNERNYRWEQGCWQPTYGNFDNLKYYGKMSL